MQNNTLKSDEEIRNQLLRIKSYLQTYTSDYASQAIADKIAELKREKQSIIADLYGDKVDYCLSIIDTVLTKLESNFYSAGLKETQNRIKIQILSNRLNSYRQFSKA